MKEKSQFYHDKTEDETELEVLLKMDGENDLREFSMSSAEISEEIGFSGYSDFHTIDWQRDLARDRMRHRYIVKRRQNSIWELIKVSKIRMIQQLFI